MMSSALGLNLSSPPPAAPLAAAAANENEEDEEEIRGEINAAQGKELLFCLSYPRLQLHFRYQERLRVSRDG